MRRVKRMNNKGQAEIGIIVLVALAALVAIAISTGDKKRPSSFIKTMEPGWVTIEVVKIFPMIERGLLW